MALKKPKPRVIVPLDEKLKELHRLFSPSWTTQTNVIFNIDPTSAPNSSCCFLFVLKNFWKRARRDHAHPVCHCVDYHAIRLPSSGVKITLAARNKRERRRIGQLKDLKYGGYKEW